MSGPTLSPLRPHQPPPLLEGRAESLRTSLRPVSAALLAARTGCDWAPIDARHDELKFLLFGSVVCTIHPDLIFAAPSGEPLPILQQTLLLFYFATADGVSPADEWISFAELPDGRVYSRAFQSYAADPLIRRFGSAVDQFQHACLKTGGVPAAVGDAAFTFQALPRLPLLVTYWIGDEDFPSACRILFDRSARHYLPTDACAILGGMLAHRILAAA